MRKELFLLLLFASTVALAQNPKKEELKVRAQLAKGKAYPAIRKATAMLGKDPHPEFYALRAEGYNNIGEFTKAETDARRSLQLLPDSVSGLYQLAMAEQGMGRLDSAAIHLTEVLRRAPTANYHYSLAVVEQMRKRLPEAMQQIDKAIALEGANGPSSARLHRVKGEVAAMSGDSTLALTELDRAITLAPEDPVNYNSRGFYAHAWLGHHRAAVVDYDRAIKLNPNYSYAFNNRGWSEYKLGDTKKGVWDIERARKKKMYNPFVYRNLGVIALETGDTAKACGLLRQALDRGFTELYGNEVVELMGTSCKGRTGDKPRVPVQAPHGNMDKKTVQPAPRNNAPE